jgi:hypothetical protein
MTDKSYELCGVPILECAAQGPVVRTGTDATDLISAAWSHKAELVVVPLARLDDGFLTLSTGIAGEIIQKFVTYGLRLAIVGDIGEASAGSAALRDFVYESNRGRHVWFTADLDALREKLARS